MVTKVWEIYKKDSQHCLLFKTQKLALNQTIFEEIDIISPAHVDLSDNEIYRLEMGEAVWIYN